MTKREEIVSVAESKVGLNRNEVGCGGDGAWCAMFVSGVLVIVGIGEGVTSDSCTLMQRYMSESDKWSEPDDWPIPGDIIFFDWDNKKEERPLDHVGICVGFNNDTLQITYVNGNGDSSYYVTEEEINVNAKGKDGHNLVAYWMRYVGDEESKEPEYEDNSITSQFEDGTVQSRRKFTKSRTTWNLKWGSMKQSDFLVLENFIKNVAHFKANVFNWTNPIDNVVYSVRCMEFKASLKTVNYWEVSLKLQEA